MSGHAPVEEPMPEVRAINLIKLEFDRVWHRAAAGVPHLSTKWQSSNARELERANNSLWNRIRELRDQHRWTPDGIKTVLDQDLAAEQQEVFANHVDAALMTADYQKAQGKEAEKEPSTPDWAMEDTSGLANTIAGQVTAGTPAAFTEAASSRAGCSYYVSESRI